MGFNFNKLGDVFTKIGMQTFQTGAFLATTKAINSPCNMGGSVFGCGSFGNFGGYSGCGNIGGYSGGYMGMSDPYATQMAIGQSYGQGYALGEYLKQNAGNSLYGGMGALGSFTPFQGIQGLTTNKETLKPTDNKAAEKFYDQPTELGKRFEEHVQDKKDTTFVTTGWKKMENGKEKDADYKEYVSNFAKSYVAHMDQTSGNKDNEISSEEFINYNMSVDLDENATDEEKATYKKFAENSFKKFDQNGDKIVDWKEIASAMSTYDANHDGTITNEEMTSVSEGLIDSSNVNIDKKFRSEYTRLFGQDKQ